MARPRLPSAATLFNPLAEPITRNITLPLHYTGLRGQAHPAIGAEGKPLEVQLDAHHRTQIQVTIPSEGYLHVFARD